MKIYYFVFTLLFCSGLIAKTPCKKLLQELVGEKELSHGRKINSRIINTIEKTSHKLAISWIEKNVKSYGLTAKFQKFSTKVHYRKNQKLFTKDRDFDREIKLTNIIVDIPSKIQKNEYEENEVIIVGAHFDGISTKLSHWFGKKISPKVQSADDNGSGSVALLHLINKFKNHNLPYDLRFIFFDGEELGLLGSKHYTETSSDAELAYIRGIIILDMIGYNSKINQNTYNLSTFNIDHTALRKALLQNNDLFPILNTEKITSSFFILPLSDGKSFMERGVPTIMISDCMHLGLIGVDHPLHTENDNYNSIDWKYFGKMLQNIEKTITLLGSRKMGLIK